MSLAIERRSTTVGMGKKVKPGGQEVAGPGVGFHLL